MIVTEINSRPTEPPARLVLSTISNRFYASDSLRPTSRSTLTLPQGEPQLSAFRFGHSNILAPTIILMISILLLPAYAQPVPSSLVHQKMLAACQYLKSVYNPALQLVRTSPFTNVYYISSDNLLAQQALSLNNCDILDSQVISQTITTCCGEGNDLMHEALLGRPITLPIHAANIYTIANSSAGRLFRNITPTTYGANYTVLQEVHNSTSVLPDCTYADATAITALELKREGNTTAARREIDCLNLMFDGFGLVDEAYKDGSTVQHGIYQTLNLALYTYALQKISTTYYSSNVDNLLRTQGPDGGFHTGYDQKETYASTQENAETTAIALLTLPTTPTSQFPLPPIPAWIPYFILGWVVVAVAILVLVLVIERRKKTARYHNLTANPVVK